MCPPTQGLAYGSSSTSTNGKNSEMKEGLSYARWGSWEDTLPKGPHLGNLLGSQKGMSQIC